MITHKSQVTSHTSQRRRRSPSAEECTWFSPSLFLNLTCDSLVTHWWLLCAFCFSILKKKSKKKSTNLSWSRHCHLNRTCSNCESSSALSPTRCCKDSWIDWACQEQHDVQSFRTRKPIFKKRWPRQDTYGYHNNTPPNTTWHTDDSPFNSPHPWAHFVIDQGLKLLSQVLARQEQC